MRHLKLIVSSELYHYYNIITKKNTKKKIFIYEVLYLKYNFEILLI